MVDYKVLEESLPILYLKYCNLVNDNSSIILFFTSYLNFKLTNGFFLLSFLNYVMKTR